MVKVIMILLFFLVMWIPTHSQKYQVFETFIERQIDSLGEIWYYPTKFKCYKSNVNISINKEYVSVKTDSVSFKIYVLKHLNIGHRDNPELRVITKLLTAKGDQIFFVEEFYHKSIYYFIYIPIKLHMKNKMLGGYGRLMIICSKEENCDT